MHICVSWLNSLLEPGGLTAERAEAILTAAGFPIESRTPLAGGDAVLDVEVTSNRGDCLSHAGVAREIAAATGAKFLDPAANLDPSSAGPGTTGQAVTLENRVAGAAGCPMFTLRVIRGVKVGPSPAWLAARLEALGQRSINNVVDATNYASLELGNPSHVFDLGKVAGAGRPGVIVRGANAGEKLALLDGQTVELRAGELVVADASGAISLAGIMGGATTAVSGATSDVLLEVATWTPGMVRRAARRLGLRTEASHRFERFVDPRTLRAASDRITRLIVELAGGKAEPGLLTAGEPVSPRGPIGFRADRCRAVLGVGFDDGSIGRALAAQGVRIDRAAGGGGGWSCVPPDHRPDLRIEEDLIEEVARTLGLEAIPVNDRVSIRVQPPQAGERGVREVARVLTGMGFEEAVTFSFVSEKAAKPFLAGGTTLTVSDERRKGEGTLRPSALPSLLECRRVNQDHKAAEPGTVRLFELANVYHESAPGKHHERRMVALLADCPLTDPETRGGKAFDRQRAGVRLVRGVIETLARSLGGAGAKLVIVPDMAGPAAFDPHATATARLSGAELGRFGLLSPATQKQYDLTQPVVVAELELAVLLAGYPPRSLVHALPQFPAIERDINIVMDWGRRWADFEAALERAVRDGAIAHLEQARFVSLFPDPKDAGKKRVLVRLTFRDQGATLTGEAVDTQMEALREQVVSRVGVSLEEHLKQATA